MLRRKFLGLALPASLFAFVGGVFAQRGRPPFRRAASISPASRTAASWPSTGPAPTSAAPCPGTPDERALRVSVSRLVTFDLAGQAARRHRRTRPLDLLSDSHRERRGQGRRRPAASSRSAFEAKSQVARVVKDTPRRERGPAIAALLALGDRRTGGAGDDRGGDPAVAGGPAARSDPAAELVDTEPAFVGSESLPGLSPETEFEGAGSDRTTTSPWPRPPMRPCSAISTTRS